VPKQCLPDHTKPSHRLCRTRHRRDSRIPGEGAALRSHRRMALTSWSPLWPFGVSSRPGDPSAFCSHRGRRFGQTFATSKSLDGIS
jgi:hypothetical protein